MRVLVTRPEPDASLTAERLRAAGYEVLIAPMLETVFLNEPLDDMHTGDFVVTSRNGVRALAKVADEETRETRTLYTVGDATAALARGFGFKHIRSASGAVDQLVDLIGPARSDDRAGLIYVCGRDRKGRLEDKLKANGWQVDVAVRYYSDSVDHLSPDILTVIESETIDAVLLYSNRTAEAFEGVIKRYNLSQLTNSIKFFCLAKGIESVFDRYGKIQLIVVEHPNEQSMFDALAHYQNRG
ncbi:MAG: uroporphyrinogen-III synthase [Hyphomicrobiales bacterium]